MLVFSTAALHAQQADTIIPPRLQNAGELARALEEAYPTPLRARGVGAIAQMRLFINEQGEPDSVSLSASTGLRGFDEAASRVARQARFSPAMRGVIAVGGWVAVRLQFLGQGTDYGQPPVTVPVEDRDELSNAIHSFYPADLRRLQLGAIVGLALDVSGAGTVIGHELVDPSCFREANEAAAAVTRTMRFAPAVADDATPRRSYATVSFLRDSVRLTVLGDTAVRDAMMRDPAEPQPASKAPTLRNRYSVQRSLVENYPARLREAGIGGSADIWLWIEPNGRVTSRTVSSSSGYCELDIAALSVAEVMRFAPATLDGAAVGVWVRIPIIFSSR